MKFIHLIILYTWIYSSMAVFAKQDDPYSDPKIFNMGTNPLIPLMGCGEDFMYISKIPLRAIEERGSTLIDKTPILS